MSPDSFPVNPPTKAAKPPNLVLEGLFAFAPNRETLGGVSYLIVENSGNILIDPPAWEEVNTQFLHEQGVRWLFLTHRSAHSQSLKALHQALGCEIVLQEQEAYLLPHLPLTTFAQEIALPPDCLGFWSPGHSPGSACFYWPRHGGVLFPGRHLLPNQQGEVQPLRTAKTFHWYRQLSNIQSLRERFTSETLSYLAPAANLGFLRGKKLVSAAYQQISSLDLSLLRQSPILW
jgi:glyoxylase-like metal-dependent hydrolase (beta-lactamase superfamily II)